MKVWIQNSLSKSFQQLFERCKIRHIEDTHYLLTFKGCWQNDNVTQWLRRAHASCRAVSFIVRFYPKGGGTHRAEFNAFVTKIRSSKGTVYCYIVAEPETFRLWVKGKKHAQRWRMGFC